MQAKTKAIVLKYLKYTDNSIIAYLLTKKFGKQTFIIKGIRGKKSKIKINNFYALSILDIETIQKAKANIYTIKEARANFIPSNINDNIKKNSISLFIAEILYKVLENEEIDENLFIFIEEFIKELDEKKTVNNIHLIFLIRLTSYLGFLPNTEEINLKYNKLFTFNYVTIFNRVLETNSYNIELQEINNSTRKHLLRLILNYYSLHVPNFNEIKSLDVLEDVFS